MRPNRAITFVLACAWMVASAGCAQQRAGGPAPVTFGTQAVAPSAAGAVTVAAGDTLYEISRRYRVPARELIELNRLEAPYHLRIGQRLELPTARFHVVQPGDTLYAVSRMYQADMAELARVNGLAHPFGIRVGQSLRLPGANGVETRTATAPEPARPPRPDGPAVAAAVPGPTPTVTVQPLPAPAPVPATPPATSSAPPMIQPPSKPEPVRNAPVPVPAIAPGTAPVIARTEPVPPTPETVAVPSPPSSAPAARPAAAPPPVVEPPPRASSRFAWPVHGEILSDFGSKDGGLHNDGINIAAPAGTQVIAAENGVVAYAGNELRGFGNLLLIRHADGWMTAYAHLDRMAVERGDRVGRGQAIGTVGSTGNVGVPQLHFEVRRGSRAVDPKDLLDGKRVSRASSPGARPDPG